MMALKFNDQPVRSWTTKSGYRIIRILDGRSNVFLLTCEEHRILIDTSSKSHRKLLEKRLNKLGITRIDYLVLTHTHFDHAANAQYIRKIYKAQVIVHKNEADYLAAGRNIMIKGTNPFARSLVAVLKYLNPHLDYTPCPYDITVDSMMDLKEDGFNMHILHTPGHTPGSMSIIVDDEIAMVGDTMVGAIPNSIFPPFAIDIQQLIKSWGRLLETKCSWFLPSHGSENSRELVQKEYDKWSNKLK